MGTPIRVLVVEDNEDDCALVVRELGRGGYEVTWKRVQTAEEMAAALDAGPWELILSDFRLPRFSGPEALALCRERDLDLPFIIVSGTIGEEQAVESLKAGAHDFLIKGRLARLCPAVQRELREAGNRRDRKLAELELERQRQALYQSEKLAAMGALLAGVAHELNNPLGVVIGQANLLHRAAGEGPLAERAAKIERAAERCARIVKNFLALARDHPPERRPTHLNEIVREAVELFAYPLRVENVALEVDLGESLPVLSADPQQLHQVLVNLVTNARHALKNAPPPRRLALRTRLAPPGDRVVIEVRDNGHGIAPELQARVFDPFFTTKAPDEGTGLGLSLCKGIVEGHGGTMAFESVAGQGTLFRIELPVPAGPVPPSPPGAPATAVSLKGTTALVVDDEAALAALVAEILTEDGCDVESASSGAEALEKLGGRAFDLVISDIKMPGLDGPALYEEASRRHPGLKDRFLFLTGDALRGGTRDFLEAVKIHHLAKPFSATELQEAVWQVLEAGKGPKPSPGS